MPNGVSCDQCVAPCATCQSNVSSCDSCTDVNMTIDNVNHTCSCNAGFVYVVASKTCTPCVSPCATCTSIATQCDSCVNMNMTVVYSACVCGDGYFADSTTTCAICVAPCNLCDDNGCLSCLSVN
jgi:proprotein convertase subtilisin/kexin type 5